MNTPYSFHAGSLTGPFSHAVAAVIGADLATPCRALYVGAGGDVAVTTVGGETVIFKNAPTGSVIPVRAIRIETAGTTASDIVAGW